MASKEKRAWAFRTPEPLTQRIEEFANENQMSQSDALRTLVRSGLEAEEIREEMNELEQRVEQLEQQRGLLSRLF
ncbi:ORF10 [Halorubrum pleomorphic virus 6]|uniref:ORF10 n=1 Tax=Halorubrum pleomorphic virus 6 TaxID=1156721 RepID=H9ABQ1_9VIRU|nr:ORF10 [Halorubrum pleomorphic virus 6]AFD04021.1 ORF10 [Halorubrum pleomorphic virus 6]